MAYENNSIFWVEVEKIVPNPFQPRREFNEDKLKELSESIRMYGVLQPLVVTKREIIDEDGAFSSQYELIAGERRLRASKLAGLSQVPVIIRSGEETELMKLELAIIENLQREDLNAVDRALAFKQLAEQFGLSHSEVARKVGRSREYVSNSIRLLMLPETILNALRVGDISDGHARTLLMLNDRPEEQDVVFREILLKKLSVREVERIARKIATDKVRKKDLVISPGLIEIERQFTESLGTRVQIQKTDFGGKLTIDYFEEGDLQKILDLIHRGEEGIKKTDWSKTDEFKDIAAAAPLVPVSFPDEEEESLERSADNRQDSFPEVPQEKPYESPIDGESLYTRHDSLEHAVDPDNGDTPQSLSQTHDVANGFKEESSVTDAYTDFTYAAKDPERAEVLSDEPTAPVLNQRYEASASERPVEPTQGAEVERMMQPESWSRPVPSVAHVAQEKAEDVPVSPQAVPQQQSYPSTEAAVPESEKAEVHTERLAQHHSADVPEVTPESKPQTEGNSKEDEDLYSIRNFSL